MNLTICLIQAVAFLDLLAVGLIVPLVPNYTRKLGANPLYIGLLGSVYAGFQLGSGPVIGSLSDIKGRKTILTVTLLLCSIAYITLGFTTSLIVILVLRAFLGLFKQTQMLTKALIPDYEPNEKKQSGIYGKMAAISGVGITVGPVIGGHIIEDYPDSGFTYVALLVGFCFVLNAGMVSFLPNPIKKPSKNQPVNSKVSSMNLFHSFTSGLKQTFAELLKVEWSEYWDIFTLKALVGFAMGVYYSNYAVYLKTQYELTPKYVGYVISFQGIIGSVSSYFMEYIDKFYKRDEDFSERNFHVFCILSLSMLGFVLSFNVYIYVLWLIPLAVGNAVGRLVTLEMILKRSHGEHRGTLIGASNSVRSLAGVVAPMTAGFIGHYVGVKYVVYASLFSTLVGALMSYRVKKRSELEKEKDE